jgi:hypothetical protein
MKIVLENLNLFSAFEFCGEFCEKLLSLYGFHLDRTALTTALREELHACLRGSPM